ncbi:hypothetical protein HPB47_004867 [Ixodes persulcatus]|uniref:Uncharacterized protein n=1 Tax=Ixodes persulcatus TaxID=34615 RepID=A0AC60PER4_IXOPE|nr:hypothetical protein HPB47_004867 [Ixodes persulcatus]
MTTIFDIQVSAAPHRTLNTERGVLSETQVLDSSEEEILEGLRPSRASTPRQATLTAVFNRSNLTRIAASSARSSDMGREAVEVPRLARNVDTGHVAHVCESDPKCANCSGAHPACSRLRGDSSAFLPVEEVRLLPPPPKDQPAVASQALSPGRLAGVKGRILRLTSLERTSSKEQHAPIHAHDTPKGAEGMGVGSAASSASIPHSGVAADAKMRPGTPIPRSLLASLSARLPTHWPSVRPLWLRRMLIICCGSAPGPRPEAGLKGHPHNNNTQWVNDDKYYKSLLQFLRGAGLHSFL